MSKAAFYIRVSACLWMLGGLLFSFVAETGIVLFARNAYLLPLSTLPPVPLAAP